MKTRNSLHRRLTPLAIAAGLLGLAMGPLPQWGITDCKRVNLLKPSILAVPFGVTLTLKAGSDPVNVLSYTVGGTQTLEAAAVTGGLVTITNDPLDPVKGVILKDAVCGNGIGARGLILWL